jgi:hypothetical protein
MGVSSRRIAMPGGLVTGERRRGQFRVARRIDWIISWRTAARSHPPDETSAQRSQFIFSFSTKVPSRETAAEQPLDLPEPSDFPGVFETHRPIVRAVWKSAE